MTRVSIQAELEHHSLGTEFERETEIKDILKSNHHNTVTDLHAVVVLDTPDKD